MTPDDVGGLPGDTLKARARQNVIFELGFFIGKLGPDRVCALVAGDIEKPSPTSTRWCTSSTERTLVGRRTSHAS